jgi:hypothetical protein
MSHHRFQSAGGRRGRLTIDFALAAGRNEGKNSCDSIGLRFRPILMTATAALP